MTQRVDIMKRVLFVCTGNTCRSPMAELIFNAKAREKGIEAVAQSAGLCTIEGLLIHDNSKLALSEIGIESDFFRSTDIYDLNLEDYDFIVGMTIDHIAQLKAMGIDSDKVIMLNEDKGGIADPYGGNEATYRACRDEIVESLGEVFDKL